MYLCISVFVHLHIDFCKMIRLYDQGACIGINDPLAPFQHQQHMKGRGKGGTCHHNNKTSCVGCLKLRLLMYLAKSMQFLDFPSCTFQT